MTQRFLSQVRPADEDHPETYALAYRVKVELMQVPAGFRERFGTDVFREVERGEKLVFTPITDSATKELIVKLGE